MYSEEQTAVMAVVFTHTIHGTGIYIYIYLHEWLTFTDFTVFMQGNIQSSHGLFGLCDSFTLSPIIMV